MKYVRVFMYWVIQWTWGIIQNLIGLFLFIKSKKLRKEWYHGALVSYHDSSYGGVSLGMFVFVNGKRDEVWTHDTRIHEYGHTIQSLILGPLYLFVIGIPSMIWCNGKRYQALRREKGVSYYEFYPEFTANWLGEKVTREIMKESYRSETRRTEKT